MSQLICRNLTLGYDGKVIAENINFSAEKGDYICIVGENGSGKSTLMKSVLGLVPIISGEVLTGDGLRPTKIGYLPQQSEVQSDFPATVKEIVLSGCLNHCSRHFFYTKSDRKRATENIKRLSIQNLANKSYLELSGGQQQRVLLARALCATTEMLLLDEPTASLDPKATAELYDIIKKLNYEDKITVIMISHNIEDALKYATHILHIGDNKHFYGSVSDYLKSDVVKTFNLNVGGGKDAR